MKKPQGNIELEGIMAVSSKGVGYLRTPDREESVEIEPAFLNTALHGDRVRVALHPKRPDGTETGEVVEILARAKAGFAGVLEEERGIFFVVPDDPKMYVDIVVPKDALAGAQAGDKVFATIVEWKDAKKNPIGAVAKVLGKPNENNAEMEGIALERGFPSHFPADVEKEAAAIEARGIEPGDYEGRRDFRQETVFTIDPEDAKDFDDAISYKDLGDGTFEVGIHIADVSHYVRPGTALDREAIKRSTSLYLVDRTIPMLPEALSNNLCSLVPNEDRLTMSAVFVMDKDANVLKEWYGKTVIHSKRRFTYENAQEVLDEGKGDFHAELAALNALAKTLKANRFEKGAISLDQEEVKFLLDEKGVPIRAYKKVRGETNYLIEELMLLANRKVAETVAQGGGGFVYRVHGGPEQERLLELALFLKSIGYELKIEDGEVDKKELNRLLESLEGNAARDTIQTAVVRTMAKAVYSTDNIGHFGLAFEHYTHFTSPIRRYPDTVVHRLLDEHTKGKKITDKDVHFYESMCIYASEREKQAADAERNSIKYKQVEYMSRFHGKVFDGVISGVTDWGIYVEEAESKSEGLVKVRNLGNDFYTFEEKYYRLVGERTKETFTLGDRVKVRVAGTDLVRKTIDYELVGRA